MSTRQEVRPDEPRQAPPDLPPGPPQPVVVPRQIQLVLLVAALFTIWVAARAARHVVLVFIIASLIALILNPYVTFLQRRRVPRGVAIPVVYLTLLVALGGVGYALSSPISTQVSAFKRNVPHLANQANQRLADLQTFFDKQGIHVKIKDQGKTALQTLEGKIVKGSSSLISFSGSLLKSAAGAAISLVLIFVLSVYFLVYGEMIGRLVRRVMPPGDGTPEDDYPVAAQRAVSGYIRAQLAFSVIMGTTAGVALYLLGLVGIFPDGRTYAVAFAAFFGVMELVPFIGPLLGALPPIIVALFTDPLTALWVALMFVVIQQLEGHIVAPQVFGRALRINPLLVIFALLFGDAVYGLVGALIALPFAAVLRETIVYLRRHVVLEPWTPSSPPPPG